MSSFAENNLFELMALTDRKANSIKFENDCLKKQIEFLEHDLDSKQKTFVYKMELLMEWARLAPNREISVNYQNGLLSVEISQDVPGEGVYVNIIKFDDFETIEDLNNLLYDDIDGTELAYF